MASMGNVVTSATATITIKGAKQRLTELLEDMLAQAETDEQAEQLLEALDLAALLHDQQFLLPQQTWTQWPNVSGGCSACAQSGVCNCVRYTPTITC